MYFHYHVVCFKEFHPYCMFVHTYIIYILQGDVGFFGVSACLCVCCVILYNIVCCLLGSSINICWCNMN